MSNFVCYLVTVLYVGGSYDGSDTLMHCALKVKRELLPAGKYLLEPAFKEAVTKFLPLHVKSCGHIVDIQEIFEVEIVEEVA